MTLKGVVEGSAVRITFQGCDAIDAANAAEVKREALRLAGDSPNLVMDLTGVEFVDSAGVGVLVGLFKHARTRGGRARFCGLTAGVRATLELIQLDRIFDIVSEPDVPRRR
jgi:anti-sigma B factor antagonist